MSLIISPPTTTKASPLWKNIQRLWNFPIARWWPVLFHFHQTSSLKWIKYFKVNNQTRRKSFISLTNELLTQFTYNTVKQLRVARNYSWIYRVNHVKHLKLISQKWLKTNNRILYKNISSKCYGKCLKEASKMYTNFHTLALKKKIPIFTKILWKISLTSCRINFEENHSSDFAYLIICRTKHTATRRKAGMYH